MASTHPMAIRGPWRAGFVHDYQTISSTCIGYNEFGHPVFDTKRTEIGELLYRMKYASDKSGVNEIVEAAARFMERWKPAVTIIVPMPPSESRRKEQPVTILAEHLGKRLKLPVSTSAVAKIRKTPQLKNVYDYGSSAEFVGEKTAKERRSIEPETRCGNDAPWKPWKSPKARATFPPFPPRLEIPQKARDFHIPTATAAGSHSSKLPLGSSQQAHASGGIRDLLVP
jgi:hypothetical protein